MAFSNSIPTEKLIEHLQFENHWWSYNKIHQDMDELPRRLYFDLFFPYVKETEIKRALVLMGPRRVGKTVMMHHSIQKLIEEGVSPRKICFVSIDNPIFINISLQDLFELALNASGNTETENYYVFFDEIQYLKDWERHLKVLVDLYPKTKFIVSGSAAAALKLKSSESGAGRVTDFLLPPLTFHEYIHLKKLDHLIKPSTVNWKGKNIDFFATVNIKELNEHFINYINFGGYPEIIFSEKMQQNLNRYVKADIIDKVLLRDLPSLYGIRDVQELNRFFAYLAYNTGKEFSLENLSQESGLDKNLLKKYLEYLEAAFLIKVVNKLDLNAKRFKRATAYKIYLTNPSLRSALFSPVGPTDTEIGNMVETTIFSQWIHRDWIELKYAKWKIGRTEGEVDVVYVDEIKQKPIWAVEIKWSNRFFDKPGELKNLLNFCEKNNLNTAIVTTIEKEGLKEMNEVSLNFIPVALYAYSLGVNTLLQKG